MKVALFITTVAALAVAIRAQGFQKDCCMMACCVNGDQYKCQTGANVCMMGRKFTGGPRCGAGNNGVICKKPTTPTVNPNAGNQTNVCGSGCVINGKCAPREDCFKILDKLLKGVGLLITIGGIACLCGCCCFFYWCCCSNNGRGRKLSLAPRKPGETMVQFIPEAQVEEGSYMQMK